MAIYNLGTARGNIQIDTNDLKNADIALRGAGRSMLGLGAAAVGAFGYIVGVSAQFEKQMSFVQAVTGATDAEIQALSKSAIELGKQGPFGPREVAAGFVDLAKAGLSAEEIIGGVGKAAVQLAAAGDIPFTESAEVLVNVLRSFNLSAADSTRVIDSIAGAANASTIDVADLAYSLKYAAAPAATLGVSVEDLNASLAILGNRGIRGSTAGTAMRRVFINLAAPTKQATAAMKELGIVTKDGTNLMFTSAGKLKSLPEIFQILQDKMKNLTQQQKVAALNAIFGARAVNSALILSEQGAAGFDAIMAQINQTTAGEVAAKRLDNLSGAVTRLKAALEATFIEAGSPFQDFLKNLVDDVRSLVLWFGRLPRPIQTGALATLAIFGVMALFSGMVLLTIGNMIRAIRVMGEMGHALRVIIPVLRALTVATLEWTGALLTNPIVLIILALIALAAAFYLLYTKVQGFRDFIDSVWQHIQRTWDGVLNFFKHFGENMSKIFDGVKKSVASAIDWIGDRIRGLKLGFKAFWNNAFGSDPDITTAANKMVGVAERIGMKVRGVLLTFGHLSMAFADFVFKADDALKAVGRFLVGALGKLGEFLKDLPNKLAYALGFMIGRFIRLHIEAVRLFVRLFTRLLELIIQWGPQAIKALWSIFTDILKAAFDFAVRLPGIIWNMLTTILNFLITWGPQVISFLYNVFTQVLQTIIHLVGQIPGLIQGFLSSAYNFLVGFIPQFAGAAGRIGSAIIRGIIDTIKSLPSLIWDIVTGALKIVWNLVTAAYNAAKSWAGSFWRGIKDGLGIHSPSYVEQAMMAIQAEAIRTGKVMQSSLRTINGFSASMPTMANMTPALSTIGVGTGGVVNNYNAPLIGSATIRDDSDITKLARALKDEEQRTTRGRGN